VFTVRDASLFFFAKGWYLKTSLRSLCNFACYNNIYSNVRILLMFGDSLRLIHYALLVSKVSVIRELAEFFLL